MLAGASRLVAVDTSVAVPLVLAHHVAHEAASRWRGRRRLAVCGHAWTETYAVITRLPGTARVSPADAVRLLVSNFSAPLVPRAESLTDALALFASAGIAGGATYDGWVAVAALDNQAQLASRDARAEVTYRRLGVDLEMVV
jgi:predicted nucleic acid-binding protein